MSLLPAGTHQPAKTDSKNICVDLTQVHTRAHTLSSAHQRGARARARARAGAALFYSIFFNGLPAQTLEAVYHHANWEGEAAFPLQSRFVYCYSTNCSGSSSAIGWSVSHGNWGVARLVKFWPKKKKNVAVRGCWVILKTGTERVFEVFHLRLSLSV